MTAKLGISFAEQGKNVLLIDGNVHCPSLHQLFDLGSSEGLTDVLVNGKAGMYPLNKHHTKDWMCFRPDLTFETHPHYLFQVF
ncbi:CpsD/CapB family tyrosine-protein kinase [Bacillus megaterium]|nr:CpsD/CapB family tyrosine-protein kinase [Priestia megaterium]